METEVSKRIARIKEAIDRYYLINRQSCEANTAGKAQSLKLQFQEVKRVINSNGNAIRELLLAPVHKVTLTTEYETTTYYMANATEDEIREFIKLHGWLTGVNIHILEIKLMPSQIEEG